MANKIIGNTVGIPNPQTDFKQSDPTKADYLKNSPVDTLNRLGRIAHYGDANIIPSDSSLFNYTLNADEQSYSIKSRDASLSSWIVIPYEYNGLPITQISANAFENCYRITRITIPNSVKTISANAFYGCRNVQSITIPDSVTSIGVSAFRYCTYLTSVKISDSVKCLENSAFNKCEHLKNVTIPEGVTTISYYAFYDCSGLTRITIPASVTVIEANAFSGCESLSDVYYEGTIEQWDAITVEKNNESLLTANIHYNWNPAMKGEASETYAPKETIEILNAEVATRLNVKIGYEDTLDTYTDACGGYSVWYIARQYSSFPYVNNFVPYFLYVSEERYNTLVGDMTVTKDVIVQTKIVSGRICRREKDKSGSTWSEWKEVYATKSEVGEIEIRLGNVINGNTMVDRANTAQTAELANKADSATFDGNRNEITQHYATKSEVGSIGTALDGIIAIQNTLIGGESV